MYVILKLKKIRDASSHTHFLSKNPLGALFFLHVTPFHFFNLSLPESGIATYMHIRAFYNFKVNSLKPNLII